MLFSSLPTDIIHHILSYNGTLKLRNGKYMNQIDQHDDRYKMLQTMPQIVPYLYYTQHGYLMISDTRNKIYCEKTNASYTALFHYGEKTHLIITNSNREIVKYIFIHQGFQYNFIIYKPPPPSLFLYITVYLYDLYRLFI
jgi:hypothetical protein